MAWPPSILKPLEIKMASAACSYHGTLLPSSSTQKQSRLIFHSMTSTINMTKKQSCIGGVGGHHKKTNVACNVSLEDFIGGDLIKFDLGLWLSDVEEHKALAIYPPHEGGYEGRYLAQLRYQGYYFLDLSARGLGDPETTLTKFHPVCPVSPYFESKYID